MVGFDKGSNFISMEKIFKTEVLPHQNVFLKIDIEGAEYRILNCLIKHTKQISGLVIELHSVDVHIDRIKDFIEKFPLPIVHTHANIVI